MAVPKHLQARVEPVGLLVHLAHHILYLSLQLGYLRVFHLLLALGEAQGAGCDKQPSGHGHV